MTSMLSIHDSKMRMRTRIIAGTLLASFILAKGVERPVYRNESSSSSSPPPPRDCRKASIPPPRFTANEDVGLVVLRRIRKAGSTTIFRALTRHYNSSRLQADEQNPINAQCVLGIDDPSSRPAVAIDDPSARHRASLPWPAASVYARTRVLFVTHLREPLARQKSEFYYVGPGSKKQTEKRGGKAVSNSNEEWFAWFNEAKRVRAAGNYSCVIHGGIYLDNVMVRALSGDCKTGQDDGRCEYAKHPPRLAGCVLCGRHGRDPQFQAVGRPQLKTATRVLEAFDLVIILELLSDQRHLRLIRERLFLPSDFTFGHARTVPAAHDPSRDIPPRAKARIRADNAPDIELYTDFRRRAECLL
jgi:hypothetical protein